MKAIFVGVAFRKSVPIGSLLRKNTPKISIKIFCKIDWAALTSRPFAMAVNILIANVWGHHEVMACCLKSVATVAF